MYTKFDNSWFQEVTTIFVIKNIGETCTCICINNINSFELPFWKQY